MPSFISDGRSPLDAIAVYAPSTGETFNLTNAQTAAQIQAVIDTAPKTIPYGTTLTFDFAAGTYTLDASLVFSGFSGGGTLAITGDTTNTVGTLDRILDFSGTAGLSGVVVSGCSCRVEVHGFRVNVTDDNTEWTQAFSASRCSYATLLDIHAVGTGNTAADNSIGISAAESTTLVTVGCRLENLEFGFYAFSGSTIVPSGSSTGTAVDYAYTADGAEIRKVTGETYAGGYITGENNAINGGSIS